MGAWDGTERRRNQGICDKHLELIEDKARSEQFLKDMKNSFDEMKDRIISHIHEGEKPGGIRERVFAVEKDIGALKKAQWIRAGVAGVIGGLIGSGCTDAVVQIIKFITKT